MLHSRSIRISHGQIHKPFEQLTELIDWHRRLTKSQTLIRFRESFLSLIFKNPLGLLHSSRIFGHSELSLLMAESQKGFISPCSRLSLWSTLCKVVRTRNSTFGKSSHLLVWSNSQHDFYRPRTLVTLHPSSDHLEAAESLLAAPGLSLSDDDEESSRLRISSSYRTCSTRFVCWNKCIGLRK